MHKSVTQNPGKTDGEGEAAIGVATSPLRSGRRLGCCSGISEKFPMKDDGGANVSGRSFFLGVEDTEIYLSRVGHDPSRPVTATWIEIRALYATKLSRMGQAIVGIVSIRRRPEIGWSVIRRVAVGVIENSRNIIKANPMMKSVHDPVNRLSFAANLNPNVSSGGNGPSLSAGVAGVPPLCRVLIPEMIITPKFPAQNAGCFVKLKHF